VKLLPPWMIQRIQAMNAEEIPRITIARTLHIRSGRITEVLGPGRRGPHSKEGRKAVSRAAQIHKAMSPRDKRGRFE
jgi:hypothetical protein